ncbi:MAG: glycosyltransferase family 88 protein [Legionella sp.]
MYQYNPRAHVKIWLSNNPNVFMNLENQIRLIEMREKNSNDTIHLVYDSTLLTSLSIQSLHEFCSEHRIIPIDAHSIKKKLKSENERALYHFYAEELRHLKKGGNLAVASDILRWLSPIFRHGTYTDFDFPIDTSELSSPMAVEVPLLLNIGSLKMGKKEFILANNDFVAIIDETAAQKEIEQVQIGLLTKLTQYSTDFMERTEAALSKDNFLNRHLLKFMSNRSESIYIAKSKNIPPSNCPYSSLKARAYITEIMSDKIKFLNFNKIDFNETHQEVIHRLRKELQAQLSWIKYLFFNKEYSLIKRTLYSNDDKFLTYLMKKERDLYLKSIVVCTTGPIQIANALFNNYVVDEDKFRKEVQPLSFNHYGLQNAFRSLNSIPLHENVLGMLKFLGVNDGELNDSSWLDSGKKLQASRTKQLAAQQKERAANLPLTLSAIKANIESLLQKSKKSPYSFLKRKNELKTETLQRVLLCFNQGELDVLQFKKVLSQTKQQRLDVSTQKMLDDLEKLCQDAVLFNLTKDKKIKLDLTYQDPAKKRMLVWGQSMHQHMHWEK